MAGGRLWMSRAQAIGGVTLARLACKLASKGNGSSTPDALADGTMRLI